MPSPEVMAAVPVAGDSERRPSRAVWITLALLVVVSAVGTSWDPWLTLGVLIGCVLFGLTVTWPLGVIAAMLAIGPLDLSFFTGGFKTMFEQWGGLDMNGIRLIFVSAGLGLVVITDRRYWGRLASAPVGFYLLFLAFAATTLATSEDPLEGLRLLLKLAWPLLTFLVVAAPGRTHKEIDRMVDWLLIGATVLIVINPLFILGGGVFVEDTGEVRLTGAGTHQNPFSFAMLVAVLVSLVRFVFRGQMRYLVIAAGATTWIALSLTRITFLAGAVSLGVVALYSAVVRKNYRAAAMGAGGVVVLTLLLAPVILARTFGVAPSFSELIELFQDPIRLYETINWSGRELFWAVLVLAWMASPWLGLGLGSSTSVLKSVFPEDMGLVAHNEYIRLGTDTGFVGIALFVVAMMAWLRVAVVAGMKSDPRVQEVTLPALAILMAWGVISLTDNAFDYYGPLTQFVGFFVGASLVSGSWVETSPGRPH